jgi:hypothetical protein
MKHWGSLLVVLFLAGCHKDDVDVSTLQGNPFDTDYPVNSLLTIDSIWTEATIPGAVWQQNLNVRVDNSGFPSPTDYQVRCIDGQGDTIIQYSVQHPDGQFLLENFQVTLGTTYCYDVQLMLGPEPATGHADQECRLAEE